MFIMKLVLLIFFILFDNLLGADVCAEPSCLSPYCLSTARSAMNASAFSTYPTKISIFDRGLNVNHVAINYPLSNNDPNFVGYSCGYFSFFCSGPNPISSFKDTKYSHATTVFGVILGAYREFLS